MLPAEGRVTANANPVAMAASTAFPPAAKTSAPALLACTVPETTIPWGARTSSVVSEERAVVERPVIGRPVIDGALIGIGAVVEPAGPFVPNKSAPNVDNAMRYRWWIM
jgi:hypothetical protein